jgi:hypothetical protein
MNPNIRSLSLAELFWIEIQENRLSFSFQGMPAGVHFTLSWKNNQNINLHITKNTKSAIDKPRITIAGWDQKLVDIMLPWFPLIVLRNQYKPVIFRNWSRNRRKNVRLIFFDEIEKHQSLQSFSVLAEKAMKAHSVIKRERLKIKSGFQEDFTSLFRSPTLGQALIQHLRPLTINSFKSGTSRCGILFIGNKKKHFITFANRCHILKEKTSAQDLLAVWMTPELISGLFKKINDAMSQIQLAETCNDTIAFDQPYRLHLVNDVRSKNLQNH